MQGGGGGGGGALPMQGISPTAAGPFHPALPSPPSVSSLPPSSSLLLPAVLPPSSSLAAAPAASSSSAAAASAAPSSSASSSPSELRASLLCLARTAERAERWEDVCRFMKELIKLTPIQQQQQLQQMQQLQPAGAGAGGADFDLTEDERHLLALGYKQLIGQQRSAWKTLRQIQQTQLAQQQQLSQQQAAAAAAAAQAAAAQLPGSSGLTGPLSSAAAALPPPSSSSSSADGGGFAELCEDYRQQVEKELHLQCSEVITLLETILIKTSHTPEAKVAYYKMCGDYYRYLSELVLARVGFSPAGLPGGYDKQAHELYSMAYKLAAAALPSNHPTRLAAALNLSVCLWEVLREKKAACEVAKAAFDGAIAKLEELEEAKYKDATLIMQLLRDNLTLWTTQQQPHAAAHPPHTQTTPAAQQH